MICSVKVQETSHDSEENRMLRSVNKISSYRGLFLEPYVTLLQVSGNHVSVNSKASVHNLPRLPVPKLKDTLAKYLLSVRPFLDDKEFAKTTTVVKDFEQGLGQELQAILEQRAKQHVNWLEEWWLNTAYLEYRDPVVVFSSPGLAMPVQKFKSQNDQFHYIANVLLATMEYKSLIDGDKIPAEMMGKNPLDMGQYKKVLGTCRIPWEKRDKLSYNSNSRHINVIHNNHIFRVDLWGEDNKLLNRSQIVDQLKLIVKQSSVSDDKGIGFLTSENRDNWAKAYQILLKDASNRECLTDIEKSIIVMCLDNPTGIWKCSDDDSQRSLSGAQLIHGGGSKSNGGNRWFDKTIQFVVGADGLTGLTYEHSPAEGQPIAVLTDFILKYIKQVSGDAEPSSKPKPPRHLKFHVTPELGNMIDTAKVNLDKLVNNLDVNCFKFKNYGKNFIKSQKLSPDSYIQMAIQYAFYRTHNVPGAHYESAATRMFAGGRTETIRSCSTESIEFAKTMLDNQRSAKDKVVALKNAINSHKNYTVQALQGLGVDRHLLGLKLAAIENGIPVHKLYTDPSYIRSSHMRLSTSQVALKADGLMSYGPLVADGYATCYNPRDNDINFALSAFVAHPDTDTRKYKSALQLSLQDMHDVLVNEVIQNTPSKL